MKDITCPVCERTNLEKFQKSGSFSIITCAHCGLVFVNPLPRKEKHVEYHGEDYFFDYYHSSIKDFYTLKSPLYKKEIKIKTERLNYVTKFCKPGKILDVGTGQGLFPIIAKDNGWDVYATDISKYVYEFLAKEKNLKIFNGYLEESTFVDGYFDVVTAWHTLEHIFDPYQTLLKIRSLLKPDGHLFIAVPNILPVENYLRKFLNRPHFKENKGEWHFYCFNRRCLSHLLKRAGFKIINSDSEFYIKDNTLNTVFNLFAQALWRFIKIDVSKTILIHAVKLEERTKILYIIPKLVNAGAEKHLVNLVKNLDKGKFEALICCVKELGILGETIKYSGVNVICLNRKSIYDLRIIIDIFKLIKKNRFDIVHSYLFGFDYLACLPAKLLRVPLVISSRRELASWKKLHHHFLGNLGNLFTDKVIANSEAAKNFALKNEILRPEKITTIYNGINLNEFLPFPKNKQVLSELGFVDGDIIVGMVTKFAEVKDVLTALKAMAQVRKPYPNTKYLLVGDGSLRKDMEAKARDLKLNGNIKFVGARPDIPQILSIIDIFILTSLSESLPNSVLEAMACEKPVVCTEVGGIPEVVLNAENGILARPKDYQDIAKAVINLIEKESLRNRMGVLGRKTVKERFSLERMVKEYDAFYTFAARKLHP